MPDVEACRLTDGTGKKVGVWGRDTEEVESPFPPETLAFGSLDPVLIPKGFDPELSIPVLMEGDGARMVEALGRNKVVDELDNLRLPFAFFSLSFCGEGESSIIKTQPAASSLPLDFLSGSLSLLRRDSTLFLWDSQLVLAVETLEVTEDEELIGVAVPMLEMTLWRPVRLAIRRRGTRVWIFCSRLRTLARISDTICTPLFLVRDPEDDVVKIVAVREAGGRIKLRADTGEGIVG